MDYNFETVWNKHTPALTEEIIAFWTAENALPTDENAQERAKQAVVLARDGDNRIIGISTAQIRTIHRIGQPMYYFRMYFDAAHRGMHSIKPMMKEALQALSEHNCGLPAPEALGIVIEVENSHLRKRHATAGWPLDFNFIGYSPRKLPIYAHYFKGAKLLPPARRQPA